MFHEENYNSIFPLSIKFKKILPPGISTPARPYNIVSSYNDDITKICLISVSV